MTQLKPNQQITLREHNLTDICANSAFLITFQSPFEIVTSLSSSARGAISVLCEGGQCAMCQVGLVGSYPVTGATPHSDHGLTAVSVTNN